MDSTNIPTTDEEWYEIAAALDQPGPEYEWNSEAGEMTMECFIYLLS